ncbi:hypothetical protein [Azospirillum lipoferum]|uniref:hypothetical protein n=1 Tax=Azospirillum lipoferum TaxID=193 RepID=UPI0002D7A64A|nr:hypothetical protein [Azospirillum lipoferum]
MENFPSIPGYAAISLKQLHAFSPNERGDPIKIQKQIRSALIGRDALSILAKSGQQLLIDLLSDPKREDGSCFIDQPAAEILQAYILAWGTGRPVLSSPRSIIKLWKLLGEDLWARQGPAPSKNDEGLDIVIRLTRLQTTYYRNIFSSDEAEKILPEIFSRIDAAAVKEIGFPLSDLVRSLFSLIGIIVERAYKSSDIMRELLGGRLDNVDLDKLFSETPIAAKLWNRCSKYLRRDDERAFTIFQIAETAHAPMFCFDRSDLVDKFGENVSNALFSLALTPGSISENDLSGVHLNNPVWRRPFVKISHDTLMLPLPGLIISFPFWIIEQTIPKGGKLDAAYSLARANYLEDEIERLLQVGLPSASVHRGVKWTDPATNKTWEHDVVAILGNHVFIFEAKAGRIKDATRRGGKESLVKNFRELFVAPGTQARRLRDLLSTGSLATGMLHDRKGQALPINHNTPKIVFMFGVCIEHMAHLSSARHWYIELKLSEPKTPWAPILSLGELRMICSRLDTEASLFHYLARRSSIDELIKFHGDEQDLLSMYLINGFAINGSDLAGADIIMHQADAMVRGRSPVPGDRTRFENIGVTLTAWWRLIAAEIYATKSSKHRFDILEALLNQHPGVLAGIEQRVKRWRSGGGLGGGNTAVGRVEVGNRVFVVAVHMTKETPADIEELKFISRTISSDMASNIGATDCVIIVRSKKSKISTYDGICFFRFQINSEEEN